jgi:hypothetical protein
LGLAFSNVGLVFGHVSWNSAILSTSQFLMLVSPCMSYRHELTVIHRDARVNHQWQGILRSTRRFSHHCPYGYGLHHPH